MTKARILADYVAGGTTAAEFDYMDGVTSNVQTQLNAKAALASPVLVTPNLGTPSAGVMTNMTGAVSASIGNDQIDSQHYAAGSIDAAHLHTNAVFASGTKMIFNQTASPTGWTKVTGSGNDTALRVTTGTVGTGGSVAFETAFASQTVPVHTLATSEIPAHLHDIVFTHHGSNATQTYPDKADLYDNGGVRHWNSENTGGGGSHGHGSIDLNVSYVDVIIATKD